MKYLNILLLLGVVACSRKPADYFVLRGIVPGALDSTEVTLSPVGNPVFKYSGYIINEKFELQGEMDMATYCKLTMNDQNVYTQKGIFGKRKYKEINFFVENGELMFETSHIDSLPLPPFYMIYDMRKEKNYRVTGSPAQDAFYRYQQQILPLRYEMDELKEKFNQTGDVDQYKKLKKKQDQLIQMARELVVNQQDLGLKLHVVEVLKKAPFTYDQIYLDELGRLFTSYQDTCVALREFRQYLKEASAVVQGTHLEEVNITNPEGEKVALLARLNKKGYTLLDFWASWCGPCRASFPHLREMYKRYGDKIKFISLSTDQKIVDWKRALDEEKLPWDQFLSNRQLRSNLQITLIPTFFLIDSNGRIIFSGGNSGELELLLETL